MRCCRPFRAKSVSSPVDKSPLMIKMGNSMEVNYAEFIGVKKDGHHVEEADCVDLAEKYGTPLYVSSENQLRHN